MDKTTTQRSRPMPLSELIARNGGVLPTIAGGDPAASDPLAAVTEAQRADGQGRGRR